MTTKQEEKYLTAWKVAGSIGAGMSYLLLLFWIVVLPNQGIQIFCLTVVTIMEVYTVVLADKNLQELLQIEQKYLQELQFIADEKQLLLQREFKVVLGAQV